MDYAKLSRDLNQLPVNSEKWLVKIYAGLKEEISGDSTKIDQLEEQLKALKAEVSKLGELGVKQESKEELSLPKKEIEGGLSLDPLDKMFPPDSEGKPNRE